MKKSYRFFLEETIEKSWRAVMDEPSAMLFLVASPIKWVQQASRKLFTN